MGGLLVSLTTGRRRDKSRDVLANVYLVVVAVRGYSRKVVGRR